MEGGVFDDERIVIGNKRRGRGDEEKQMGRLEKRPSGMVEYSYSGDEMINGVKYEEEKSSTPTSSSSTPTAAAAGGGLFDQLITNLVNSPKSSDVKSDKFSDDEVVVVVAEKNDDDVVKENGGHENDKENGGESFVDNIVAKLPRTLSAEDTVTAPEPDEASILLHSIIHD